MIYKFRTMNNNKDAHGYLLPDEQRLTRFGRFLRILTLDELPELFNVLKGDMSLVGPRALLVEYRDLYTPEQWRRHEMPPGMAGPVLASGRNLLDWEEKFRLDVWYVDHWSLWLDFKILARTVWKVLKREGVSAEGHATMPKFEGVGVRANKERNP
jgi:lipopolysaccharide/colanic/teichoic acid biosynthesis glycosyltransferase